MRLLVCFVAVVSGGILSGGIVQTAYAEPYLAVREGVKCASCHTNPTGGGKRNEFGRIYGQTIMPKKTADAPITHRLNDNLDIGGNFRFGLSGFTTPGEESTLAFETQRANLYLDASLLQNRVQLYLDQQFAPATQNRETWALIYDDSRQYYIKAGKLYLPYGWRLEDDSSFVRFASGLNFSNADNGVELGLEKDRWSAQLAVTNGTGGFGETNTAKRINANAVYVKPDWRVGSSVAYNDGNGADRTLAAVYSGFRVAGSEILLEVDWIKDSSSTSTTDTNQVATHIELNRQLSKGSNIKLSYEFLDPNTDIDENERDRFSLVWEMTPLPLLQFRVGTRQSQSVPQNPAENADLYFMQLHAWY